MAYLLVALAFMASILFYSFYPRSDGIETIDKPAAKATVLELLAQHSAAVSAATVLVVPPESDKVSPNRQDYEVGWPRFKHNDADQGMVEYGLYAEFMPPFHRFDEWYVGRPQTFLVCMDNETATYNNPTNRTSVCAKKTGMGSTDLLITIVSLKGLEAEYGPQYTTMVERALGESTYLSNYDHNMTKNRCRKSGTNGYTFTDCPATYTINSNGNMTTTGGTYRFDNKAHLTTNCGILVYKGAGNFDSSFTKDYDVNGEYVLSNTRHETVSVPRMFTNNYGSTGARIGNRTHLACITELYSTYAGCCDVEIPANSTTCAAAGSTRCTWNATTQTCTCDDTYKSNICGTATSGKFGCTWSSGKCVSVCGNYTGRTNCEGQSRKGCIWNTQTQKCEGSCGNMSVRPALKASPGSL